MGRPDRPGTRRLDSGSARSGTRVASRRRDYVLSDDRVAGLRVPRRSRARRPFSRRAGPTCLVGQPIAILDDGNAAAIAIAQARNDAATARLELRQKETSDPAKGPPPTRAELRAARLALKSARERSNLVAHPLRPDVTAARLEDPEGRGRARDATCAPGPGALAAAEQLLPWPPNASPRRPRRRPRSTSQRQRPSWPRPSRIWTSPDALLDIAAAKAELAKAQSNLDVLRATPPGPSAAAREEARLAVTLAQQKIDELPAAAPSRGDRTAAELDLKKAEADLEALQQPVPAATPPALAAAQAAVDLANQRLSQLSGPPNPPTLAAAQAAVDLATKKLAQLTGPPNALAVASARLDLLKTRAILMSRS